jgi:hypothetical protein
MNYYIIIIIIIIKDLNIDCIRVDFLQHIIGTVSAQNYDETDTDDYNDGALTAQEVQFADKNLLCERMIMMK